MNSRRAAGVCLAVAMVLLGVRSGAARPAGEEASAFAAADAKILAEMGEHSQVMENLEYLSDRIGPRP